MRLFPSLCTRTTATTVSSRFVYYYYYTILQFNNDHEPTLIPLKPHQTPTHTLKIPRPAPRVRVFRGKGQGRSGDTPGLPVPITNEEWDIVG